MHHRRIGSTRKGLVLALSLGLALLLSVACGSGEGPTQPRGDAIHTIMPLGASRVQGFRPLFESYRYELWKGLMADGWSFDFIGTQSDRAAYPPVDGRSFDPDHEGRGGWTSGLILRELEAWLERTGPPDVVLLSSPGGNDALQNLPFAQTTANVSAIVDVLQAANPNVTILVEQMAPGRADVMTPQVTDYVKRLRHYVSLLATEKTTASSAVIAVDMVTGFTEAMLADDVHYNEAGAVFIAERYREVLARVLQDDRE
jgi:lysophospholipase L1-like esterase